MEADDPGLLHLQITSRTYARKRAARGRKPRLVWIVAIGVLIVSAGLAAFFSRR